MSSLPRIPAQLPVLLLVLGCATAVAATPPENPCWAPGKCKQENLKDPNDKLHPNNGKLRCIPQGDPIPEAVKKVDSTYSSEVFASFPLGTPNTYYARPEQCGIIFIRDENKNWVPYKVISEGDILGTGAGESVTVPCGYFLRDKICNV